MADVEGLLRRALAPVEPPEDLATRVRSTLLSISEMAAEELFQNVWLTVVMHMNVDELWRRGLS